MPGVAVEDSGVGLRGLVEVAAALVQLAQAHEHPRVLGPVALAAGRGREHAVDVAGVERELGELGEHVGAALGIEVHQLLEGRHRGVATTGAA